jgi:6-phosphogluconolactonase
MTIFYTGSYTQNGAPAINPTGKGIGCFHLNLENGSMEVLHYTKQRNPSYLVISEDKKFLYAVEEMYKNLNPEVFAYKIEKGGNLIFLNSQKISGDYACHLAIVKDCLLVANYVSGNVLSFPILEDGSLAPSNQIIQHKGIGPDKERQEAAHVHMICPFKKDAMYVVDLTLDMAKAYQLEIESKQWKALPSLDIYITPGSGARHMVMDKTEQFAFILNELSGEVFVVDLRSSEHKIIQKISILHETYAGNAGGAAIRIHPKDKFLYASNRRFDTITIFKIDNVSKQIELVSHQSTLGKTPRDFNIDSTGKWLIAANQDSNTLIAFEINQQIGTLEPKSKVDSDTPVNICWL